MKFFYNLSIHLYYYLIKIASLWNPKAKKWIQGRDEVWSTLNNKIDKNSSYIWFHCASLGEFEQGRPLIERIKRKDPAKKIIITFFSPSGYEVRKDFSSADVVVYLPLDTQNNAQRFLETVHVEMAFFIKYEFWNYFLSELHKQKIETYLVSGIFRPSQVFFKHYGKWYADILKNFTHLYVQNEVSKELLEGINIKNVSVLGDTRFDRVHDIATQAEKIDSIEQFKGNDKLVVCGSTWPEDEKVLLHYINQSEGTKWIIAPHEVSNTHTAELESKIQKKSITFSNLKNSNPSDYDIVIADGYGYLTSLYKYADIAYVGGGFGKSIHNILEAATYGAPIIFGPKHSKFKEALDLIKLKSAFPANSQLEVEALLYQLLTDEDILNNASKRCIQYVKENTGSTDIIIHNHL
ncbi:3-deoxy-D-manno-octulosonic acid transferase [Halosquirtibacter laminarini]|uniref:3-deoxy-D-manno-octulosonic acid transferase n=1 Tax=Halosquirtibacter laminarini TaxID=3374600 RepID=A0AC61NNC9_9BACT|nr:3-deoxy-D-manno-octulosonic acid transferase [Prolixibacteraceae bacterium]